MTLILMMALNLVTNLAIAIARTAIRKLSKRIKRLKLGKRDNAKTTTKPATKKKRRIDYINS